METVNGKVQRVKKTKTGPRVLVFDIETSYMTASIWRPFENTIQLKQIQKDWSILSWSAKWLDEDKVMYMDNRNNKNPRDDKKLLKGMWNLLNEADVVITQNGISFDSKKLNARFVMNGIRKPPSPYRHIDTKRIAAKHFAFTSNGLEYLTENLCKKYKKLVGRQNFPGQQLWDQCLAGNKAAFKEMERYNKADVLSTEELYYILAPWDSSIDFSVYTDDTDHVCSCGSHKLQARGFSHTSTGRFQRYQCTSCGKWSRSRVNLLSQEKRSSLKAKA